MVSATSQIAPGLAVDSRVGMTCGPTDSGIEHRDVRYAPETGVRSCIDAPQALLHALDEHDAFRQLRRKLQNARKDGGTRGSFQPVRRRRMTTRPSR